MKHSVVFLWILSCAVYVVVDSCITSVECLRHECEDGGRPYCRHGHCGCYFHHCSTDSECSSALSDCDHSHSKCNDGKCICEQTSSHNGCRRSSDCHLHNCRTEDNHCIDGQCQCLSLTDTNSNNLIINNKTNTYNCHSRSDCDNLKCHTSASCYLPSSTSSNLYGVCYCSFDICSNQNDCSHLHCDEHHFHACSNPFHRCYCAKESEYFCFGGDVSHCHQHTCKPGTHVACHSNKCTCDLDTHATTAPTTAAPITVAATTAAPTTAATTTEAPTTTIPTTVVPTTAAPTTQVPTAMSVQRHCHQCGDVNNNIPCDLRTIYLGNLVQCPAGKDYCMTDVFIDGQGSSELYKRCVSLDECKSKWLDQTSDVDACVNFDGSSGTINTACHYCCVGDGCNDNIVPSNSTFYTG